MSSYLPLSIVLYTLISLIISASLFRSAAAEKYWIRLIQIYQGFLNITNINITRFTTEKHSYIHSFNHSDIHSYIHEKLEKKSLITFLNNQSKL